VIRYAYVHNIIKRLFYRRPDRNAVTYTNLISERTNSGYTWPRKHFVLFTAYREILFYDAYIRADFIGDFYLFTFKMLIMRF